MRRDEALAILKEHRDEIRSFGVKSIAIFGSVAHDEARPDSEIHVLVEFDPSGGLFKVIRLQNYLCSILGRQVDLILRDAIKKQLRERFLGEGISAA